MFLRDFLFLSIGDFIMLAFGDLQTLLLAIVFFFFSFFLDFPIAGHDDFQSFWKFEN